MLKRIAVGLVVAVVIALAGLYLVSLRASPLINELLREWATNEVANQSDSVYSLHIGKLHFNWPMRRVLLDSARVMTDSTRNAQRSWPKATARAPAAYLARRTPSAGWSGPRLRRRKD